MEKFKPTRNFIKKAVDEYLKRGGKVTHLEITSKTGIPIWGDFIKTKPKETPKIQYLKINEDMS